MFQSTTKWTWKEYFYTAAKRLKLNRYHALDINIFRETARRNLIDWTPLNFRVLSRRLQMYIYTAFNVITCGQFGYVYPLKYIILTVFYHPVCWRTTWRAKSIQRWCIYTLIKWANGHVRPFRDLGGHQKQHLHKLIDPPLRFKLSWDAWRWPQSLFETDGRCWRTRTV